MLAAANYRLGAIRRDHGDLDTATGYLTTCVELYRATGDTRGEALALRGLSLCQRAASTPRGCALPGWPLTFPESRRRWEDRWQKRVR